MSIVTIGPHILDVLARPVSAIPSGHDSLIVDDITVAAAGPAAATAVDLARLGMTVATLGAVGDDEAGDLLIGMLRRRGVGTGHITRRRGVATSMSIVPVSSGRDRPTLHLPGATPTLAPADLDAALIGQAAGVHVGGPDVIPGLRDPAFLAMLERARSRGAVVTLDVLSNVPRLLASVLPLVRYADYVLPNEEQALRMTGTGDAEAAARRLIAMGASGVVVTLGAEGSLVLTRRHRALLPAPPVAVTDTSGCGDAYCAGFLAGLLHGRGVVEAARWGSVAAGHVAGVLGSDAATLTLAAVAGQEDGAPAGHPTAPGGHGAGGRP